MNKSQACGGWLQQLPAVCENKFFLIRLKMTPFILFFSYRDDINRAYRKLAMLIHPDKSVAPGSEEAFKVLVDARKALLK